MTREIFIEICPECNTVHIDRISGGYFRGTTISTKICQAIVALTPKNPLQETIDSTAEPAKREELKPILCENELKIDAKNVYEIKHWRFKERSKFYELAGIFNPNKPVKLEDISVNISHEALMYAIKNGLSKAPFAITEETLDQQNGAILEILFGLIMEYNMPPQAPSSVSRLQSIPTIRMSLPQTS